MPDFIRGGLGAVQSPLDSRDYPIADHFAALGIAPQPLAALPSRYVCAPMPPVLDQGNSPECVAFSSAAEQMAYDIHDQKQWFNFDHDRFFAAIGGGPNGATLRTALDQRLKVGYPTVGHSDAAAHRIAAYYAVPRDVAAIKQAIFAFGPLVLATPWYASWDNPKSNGLLLPPSGGIRGGHAIVAWGWDNRLGFLWRNSWGPAFGMKGSCYVPFSYATSVAWEYWKAADVVDRP
jgi:C1A family cysteine protease